MSLSPLTQNLIATFKILPGIGQKSATRMALHLLERNRDGAKKLAYALNEAMNLVGNCQICRNLSEQNICHICSDTRRNSDLLCVVEGPLDLFAIEQTDYHGYYFVLNGHLSPLDGIEASDIGIDLLVKRIKNGNFKELIIATNPTVEGEATAHYIAQSLTDVEILITRLAHGMPLGGELELVDGGTVMHALHGRKPLL